MKNEKIKNKNEEKYREYVNMYIGNGKEYRKYPTKKWEKMAKMGYLGTIPDIFGDIFRKNDVIKMQKMIFAYKKMIFRRGYRPLHP